MPRPHSVACALGALVVLAVAAFPGVGAASVAAAVGAAGSTAPAGNAPVAKCDVYWAQPSSIFAVPAAAGVLANDVSPGGASLGAVVDRTSFDAGAHAFVMDASGGFTYTADAGSGLAIIAYRAVDAAGDSSGEARATIIISPTQPAAWEFDLCPGSSPLSGTSTPTAATISPLSVGTCIATFTVTEPSHAAGSRVAVFNPEDSSAGLGTTYLWNLGDGTTLTRAATTAPASITHTFPDAGEYVATLTVQTAAGCRRSATERFVVDPVTAYAPTVHLADGERYFPGDVNTFIANSTLEYRPQDNRTAAVPLSCLPTVLAGLGQVSAARLGGTGGAAPYVASRRQPILGVPGAPCPQTGTSMQSNGDPSVVSKRVISPTDHRDANDGMVLNPTDSPSLRAGIQPGAAGQPPFYYEQTEPAGGAGAIIYWFFYPYNGWRGTGGVTALTTERHEGDWEHIVVHLGASGVASEVAYYQHSCAAEVIERAGVQTEDIAQGQQGWRGWHALVWSARGGHASYPTNIGSPNTPACGTFQGKGDHTGNGIVWKPWQDARGLVDATAQPWYGFAGNWGDFVQSTFGQYGPTGPGPLWSRAYVPQGWW